MLRILLWPLAVLWRLVTLIFELTGRLIAVLLGIVLLIVGVVLTLTVIGAVVGVPLMVTGVMLIVRALF